MTMVASDGFRLANVERLHIGLPIADALRVVIPRTALARLNVLLGSTDAATVQFAQDESTLFFAVANRLLASRRLAGNFPNYEAACPRDNDKIVTVDSKDLASALQRMAEFADEHSSAVCMKLEDSELKISASNAETGQSEESIPVAYGGPSIQVRFSSRYLLDFLKAFGSGEVRLRLKDGQSAAELHPGNASESDCKYRCVVMPMRG